MAIEHDSIVDSELHEPKGVASASAGEAYLADGAGSGAWGPPQTGVTADYENLLVSLSTITQGPTALDTPHQVTYGAAVGGPTDPVQLSAAGAITFNEAGQYYIVPYLSFGRTSATGVSEIVVRPLVNGVELFGTTHLKLDSANIVIPVYFPFLLDVSAGDVYTTEFLRDSTGNNSGDVIVFNPALAGWGNSPSAIVSVYKARLT